MIKLARLVATSACAAGLLTAAPAGAQARTGEYTYPTQAPAQAQGYRDGLDQGDRDARERRAFSFEQDRQYQRYPRNYPPDGRARGRNFRSVAYNNGFSDGYERGLDDARDGDRYDLIRDRRYRSADHGYRRQYGDRQYYKNIYRDGFRAGYDQGYREGQRYREDQRYRRRGPSGRSRWPWRF